MHACSSTTAARAQGHVHAPLVILDPLPTVLDWHGLSCCSTRTRTESVQFCNDDSIYKIPYLSLFACIICLCLHACMHGVGGATFYTGARNHSSFCFNYYFCYLMVLLILHIVSSQLLLTHQWMMTNRTPREIVYDCVSSSTPSIDRYFALRSTSCFSLLHIISASHIW